MLANMVLRGALPARQVWRAVFQGGSPALRLAMVDAFSGLRNYYLKRPSFTIRREGPVARPLKCDGPADTVDPHDPPKHALGLDPRVLAVWRLDHASSTSAGNPGKNPHDTSDRQDSGPGAQDL